MTSLEQITLENWDKHISKYYGAMFECGDFDALFNDVKHLLYLQKTRDAEIVEKADCLPGISSTHCCDHLVKTAKKAILSSKIEKV